MRRGETPGDICSFFSSCPVKANVVVSALELLGPVCQVWLEEEETQWKGG